MRSLFSVLTLSLVPLLFMAPELSAQPAPGIVYAVESLGYEDGTFSSRRLVYDRQTGQFSPIAEHDSSPVAPQAEALLPPNFMFQPLIVLQSSRWAGSAPRTFRVAEDAPTNSRILMKNIARVRAVMNFVHKRRGSLALPRFLLSNQNVPVQEMVDPVLEYQQFNLDGRNVVARTADNRLFRFDPPGVSSRALRFEFATADTCTLAGGVYRCRFFIQECDIYLKARTMMDPGFFEDRPALVQRRNLAGHYKFCQGHNFNTWSHDLGGNRNREVTNRAFTKNNTLVWNGERAEDQLLYGDPGVAAITSPQSPTLHPQRDSVIDLGFVKPPVIDRERSARENLFGYFAIALTNLRGFSKGKDLRLQVFKGDSSRLRDRIIGPLRGASLDRVPGTFEGKTVLAHYRMSYLTVGRKVHFDTLLRALKRPVNADKKVRGRAYDYAMKVTIVVNGFLTENGSRKSVKNVYWLVFNEGEERDPDVELASQFP